jgi:hypothetical protein
MRRLRRRLDHLALAVPADFGLAHATPDRAGSIILPFTYLVSGVGAGLDSPGV